MIYATTSRQPDESVSGLGGNYATDLVRCAAARGAKLIEVEPDAEAVFLRASMPADAKSFRQIF